MGIRVLVTGVSGFLGSWAVKGLADAGHQAIASNVRCQDRLFRAILPETTPDQVTWRGLDVDDNDVVDTIVGEAAPEAIVHLAARLFPACRDEPAAAAQVNVVGHINVFEAARRHGVGQVVYASSLAARLRHDDGTHRTICGTFKHWNETFAATYFAEHVLPSVGLRPAIVYGPGREAGATAFVNQAIAATAANEPYQLPQRWCSRLEYVEQVAAIFCQRAVDRRPGVGRFLDPDHRRRFYYRPWPVAPGCRVTDASDKPVKATAPDVVAALQGLSGVWRDVDLDDGIRRTIDGMAQLNP
ncbi:MAG: NAD(P)-dependent oxidoreductase [Pseudomonadota bacterium]|nr:NAD(P)-dependent oxidoreductase [Pseudomonadota bacterium]